VEKAIDKEAIANLKLIQAAEKIYRMEIGGYYASTPPHIDNINTNLRLELPAGSDRKWDYQTQAPTPSTCCAQATRVTDGRTYRIRHTEENPVEGGTCP